MYTREEITRIVEDLAGEQPWNHSIELPYGIRTAADEQVSHGKNLVKWSRIKKYVEMIGVEGMRVLDVGCNEGFFSLKLAELGAKEVVAVDVDELRIEKAKAVCDILEASNVTYEVADIFDTGVEKYGHFDLVLGSFDLPIMKFCGGHSKDSNVYSGLYWLPSVQCVVDMLKSLGFLRNLIIDNSSWRRAIVISSRHENPVFKNRDMLDVNKFTMLRRITRSYLGNVLRTLKNKETGWR
jgi:SAM-dependent methyltransferase